MNNRHKRVEHLKKQEMKRKIMKSIVLKFLNAVVEAFKRFVEKARSFFRAIEDACNNIALAFNKNKKSIGGM